MRAGGNRRGSRRISRINRCIRSSWRARSAKGASRSDVGRGCADVVGDDEHSPSTTTCGSGGVGARDREWLCIETSRSSTSSTCWTSRCRTRRTLWSRRVRSHRARRRLTGRAAGVFVCDDGCRMGQSAALTHENGEGCPSTDSTGRRSECRIHPRIVLPLVDPMQAHYAARAAIRRCEPWPLWRCDHT